jgi:hypothetical protein
MRHQRPDLFDQNALMGTTKEHHAPAALSDQPIRQRRKARRPPTLRWAESGAGANPQHLFLAPQAVGVPESLRRSFGFDRRGEPWALLHDRNPQRADEPEIGLDLMQGFLIADRGDRVCEEPSTPVGGITDPGG